MSLSKVAVAKVLALLANLPKDALEECGGEVEIDESRPCDLDLFIVLILLEFLDESLCQSLGRLLVFFGEHHGAICGIVAMLGDIGDLDHEISFIGKL